MRSAREVRTWQDVGTSGSTGTGVARGWLAALAVIVAVLAALSFLAVSAARTPVAVDDVPLFDQSP